MNKIVPVVLLILIVAALSGCVSNAPAPPTGVTAQAVPQCSIAINWQPSTGATSYTINHSLSPTGPFRTAGTSTTTSFTDTGLIANVPTTYYYEVAASNSIGTSAPSSPPASNTTLVPPLPIANPTGVIAQATSSSTIFISWQASTDAEYYVVWRSYSSSGPFIFPGSSTTTTFTDTGLSPGTTYYYYITSANCGGIARAPSDTPKSATTPMIDPPTGVKAQTISSSEIKITWNPPPTGATSYTIYRSTSASGSFTTPAGTSTVPSFTDRGLPAGTTYYYEVTASNSAGYTSAHSSPPAYNTTAPAAPTGVKAQTISSSEIKITWNPPPTGATSYTIYNSTSFIGPFTKSAGISTAPSFTAIGLSNGTTYYYKVTASNSGGESAQSLTASGTTLP